MLRLIYAVLLLVNHFASAQSINGLASHKPVALSLPLTTVSTSDHNGAKPAAASRTTATVVLSTKGICKQNVHTVFIIPVTDTLHDGVAIAPVMGKAASATITKEAYTMEGVHIGTGSDELELLLKTPGRLTIPAEETAPVDSSLSFTWPSYILP